MRHPPDPIASKYSCASRISLWRSRSWTKPLHCWRKPPRKRQMRPKECRPSSASSSSNEITLNSSLSESLASKVFAELDSEANFDSSVPPPSGYIGTFGFNKSNWIGPSLTNSNQFPARTFNNWNEINPRC